MNKFVFITGCSSGIGLDAAQTLKDRGYNVLASYRNSQDVKAMRERDINCIELDLADSTSIDAAIAVIRDHGTLYGLINNAAFGMPGAVEDLSREALEHQFATNLFGTHQLTRACLHMMLAQNEGRIIQISSILGGLCLPFRGAYNASKYALEGLSDTMRMELDQTGVKVSLIQPGPIESQFRHNALVQFKRFIKPADSRFQSTYASVETRLNNDKPVQFTLPTAAVTDCIIHALQAKKPKIRYRVTMPTKVFLPLKRLLPDRWMDKLLLKLGDKPKS